MDLRKYMIVRFHPFRINKKYQIDLLAINSKCSLYFVNTKQRKYSPIYVRHNRHNHTLSI